MGMRAAQSSAFVAEGGVAKDVLSVKVVWVGWVGEKCSVERIR
jgi:hypothetical protein